MEASFVAPRGDVILIWEVNGKDAYSRIRGLVTEGIPVVVFHRKPSGFYFQTLFASRLCNHCTSLAAPSHALLGVDSASKEHTAAECIASLEAYAQSNDSTCNDSACKDPLFSFVSVLLDFVRRTNQFPSFPSDFACLAGSLTGRVSLDELVYLVDNCRHLRVIASTDLIPFPMSSDTGFEPDCLLETATNTVAAGYLVAELQKLATRKFVLTTGMTTVENGTIK